MICFPNAKINIGLNVLRKRSDNFHDIETCLLAVPFYDVLEIKQANKFSIDVFGEKFEGSMEDNLVYKVWKKLNVNNNIPPFEIKLLKNIPVGAGLGGGSSDAAFFLKVINSQYKLGLNLIQMEVFLSEIGSDCPFFVKNEMAIASSKGDVLKPFNPGLNDVFISIVVPKQRVSTANAYSKVIVKQPDTPLEKLLSLPLDKWKDFIDNAFESYVSARLPIVSKIKSELYNAGASFVSMSGSGSAMYSFSSKELNLISLEKQNIVWKSKLNFK
ncbi:MAG: 4-(cytidine 5'-diphospho)-2-C-methyl-D-erythritol kinase [Marinilabiliales bacterium]|nr:MAG: 4-(cytidine 5'-diphospho)-2-C-methyl-D-erythritol kinase [Marinilabiliales bacterium]